MSRRFTMQDGTTVVLSKPNVGHYILVGPTVPVDGSVGYGPGCFYILQTGTAGGQWFRNDGTFASSLFRGVDTYGVVAVGAATLTISPTLHANRTVLLDTATGIAVTLPAATGTGNKYRFFVSATASGGNYVLTATAADLYGTIAISDDTAVGTLFTERAATSAAGSTTITLNGTTTGGRKGDWIELEDVGSHTWAVKGSLNGSGTEATPYA